MTNQVMQEQESNLQMEAQVLAPIFAGYTADHDTLTVPLRGYSPMILKDSAA